MRILIAAILAVGIWCPTAFAANYKIDSAHSSVSFKIRHLTISSVHGQFVDFNGAFDFDPAKIEQGKTEATIAVKSINTEQTKRDNHLRSPDFFDAEKFPEIKFTSKKITDATPESFKLHGDLSMHGVTKPVVLDVAYGGSVKDPMGKERAAFEATAKLNRKDFGMSYNKILEAGGLVIGDEVQVSIEIEGVKEG